MSELRTNIHSVSQLSVHFVWIIKHLARGVKLLCLIILTKSLMLKTLNI